MLTRSPSRSIAFGVVLAAIDRSVDGSCSLSFWIWWWRSGRMKLRGRFEKYKCSGEVEAGGKVLLMSRRIVWMYDGGIHRSGYLRPMEILELRVAKVSGA